MRTSVVVVAYKLSPWLRPCIESVLAQADEVVVVDNGSPESVVAAQGRAVGAKTFRLDRNTGFTGGYNYGVERSTGDIVAILNDDAFAGDGWLASAADALADPGVAATCPKLVFAMPHAEVVLDDTVFFAPGDARPLGRQIREVTVGDVDVLADLKGPGVHGLETVEQNGTSERWRWTAGPLPFYVPLPAGAGPGDVRLDGSPAPVKRVTDVVNNAGSFLTTDGYGGDRGSGLADDGQFDEPGERFAACGAAMAFRRETWHQLGALAPHFFAYYEDTDWCWRAQLAGRRIMYRPDSVVRHVGGASSGGLQSLAVRNLSARNRLLCLTRNAPLGRAWQQVRTEVFGVPPEGLRRGPLAVELPRALAQRGRLRSSWQRSPVEVWDQWAGVGAPDPVRQS